MGARVLHLFGLCMALTGCFLPGPPVATKTVSINEERGAKCMAMDFQSVFRELGFTLSTGEPVQQIDPCQDHRKCQKSIYIREKKDFGNFYISVGCGELTITEGGNKVFSDEGARIITELESKLEEATN